MSTKPVISQFSQIASLLVQEYERYLPTAFDESLSLIEKVNKIIQKLNEIGLATNDLINQWNEVMEWVMNDGLTEAVKIALDEMVTDGTFDELLRNIIFGLETQPVNVKFPPNNYEGAIGDGVTDDYAKLQTLFDNFTDLYFPDGEFYVTQSLTPKTGTKITGKGTIKGAVGQRWSISSEGVDKLSIKDVHVTVSGIQVLDGEHINIENVKFHDVIDRPCLEFAGVSKFSIKDNDIRDSRMGIHVINSNTGVVSGNLVENIGGGRSNGVNENALGQIAILLWGNSNSVYGSEKVTRDISVTGNICRNGSDNGIRLIAERYHDGQKINTGQLYNCSVVGNEVDGFYVDGIRVTGDHCTVTGNTVRNCSYGGIRSNGCVGLVISSNEIRGDSLSKFGVTIGLTHENSSGSKITIIGNIIEGCDDGISIFGGTLLNSGGVLSDAYDVKISNNHSEKNRNTGITAYRVIGANINSNTVKQNGKTGIDCTGSFMIISGNILESNNTTNDATGKHGIIANANDSSIYGNRIFNQLNGVGLTQKGTNVLEYGNVFHGNTLDKDYWTDRNYVAFNTFGSSNVGSRTSANPKNGDMYFDGNAIRLYVGGVWKFIPITSVYTSS